MTCYKSPHWTMLPPVYGSKIWREYWIYYWAQIIRAMADRIAEDLADECE